MIFLMELFMKANSTIKTNFKVTLFINLGDGILYFSNGNAFYSGSWKKNQFHGFGILNNI